MVKLCWYEDGMQKFSTDGNYPKGVYKYVDGLFTRVSKKDASWCPTEPPQKVKPEFYQRGPYGIMDTLGEGVQGIHNPVDGKRYDSKSAYYRKLKETGHHVYEGKPSGQKVLNKGDHNVFKELKQAAQQHGLI